MGNANAISEAASRVRNRKRPIRKSAAPDASVQAGEPRDSAVPRLLDEYGPRLYALGLRLCRNSTDAEDLVQNTLLRAWQSWERFEGRSSPGTWLYTIAARVCRRMHRLRAGQPGRPLSLDAATAFAGASMVDPAAAAHGRTEPDQEQLERIQRAIAELPASYRIPLVFKDILGMSLEDVARALELKTATVKTRVHRARLHLRGALARALPRRSIGSAAYSKRVCLDLLQAKLEAMDAGRAFPVENKVICERCLSVFATLDLGQDLCGWLALGELPESVRRSALNRLAESTSSATRR